MLLQRSVQYTETLTLRPRFKATAKRIHYHSTLLNTTLFIMMRKVPKRNQHLNLTTLFSIVEGVNFLAKETHTV